MHAKQSLPLLGNLNGAISKKHIFYSKMIL